MQLKIQKTIFLHIGRTYEQESELVLQKPLTIKDFCQRYVSIISLGSLRWILFNSKFNGADCFVRRIGQRKLLVSPLTISQEGLKELQRRGLKNPTIAHWKLGFNPIERFDHRDLWGL